MSVGISLKKQIKANDKNLKRKTLADKKKKRKFLNYLGERLELKEIK